jgi:uncharacterized protein (TIGR02466 family)
MKINNLKLFPTVIKYTQNFLSVDECTRVLKDFKKIKLLDHFLLSGNAKSSYYSENNILDYTYKNLYNRLNDISNDYAKELGLKNVTIFNSWINVQNRNSSFKRHCHAGCTISAALYLKINKKSSSIKFFNPNPYSYTTPFIVANESNFNYVSFNPEPGDLILFPSWLQHSAEEQNNKSNKRIVLSFNANN